MGKHHAGTKNVRNYDPPFKSYVQSLLRLFSTIYGSQKIVKKRKDSNLNITLVMSVRTCDSTEFEFRTKIYANGIVLLIPLII